MTRSLLLLALCCVSGGCAHAPSGPVRYVVNGAEAPAFRVPGGKGTVQLLVNAETGASAAALDVLDLQPGAGVPEHVHEHSVEMIYIQEGRAEMTVDGQALSARAGDAVYLPAGVRHSVHIPEDTSRFRAVQVYVGPGPEQRFRQGEPVTSPPSKAP